MDLCSVEATDIRVLEESAGAAQVSAHVAFNTGGECSTTNEVYLVFELVYDHDNGWWRIDAAW